MRASELRISSERPSEKNTLSLSSDRFSNGKTAIDLAGMSVRAVAGAGDAFAREATAAIGAGICDPENRHMNAPPNASNNANSSNSIPVTFCTPRSPWYQASSSVMKKPAHAAMISPRSIASGQPNLAATMSMPCSSANANATYARVHCTSLRCLRRAMSSFMVGSAGRRVRQTHLLQHSLEARIVPDRIESGIPHPIRFRAVALDGQALEHGERAILRAKQGQPMRIGQWITAQMRSTGSGLQASHGGGPQGRIGNTAYPRCHDTRINTDERSHKASLPFRSGIVVTNDGKVYFVNPRGHKIRMRRQSALQLRRGRLVLAQDHQQVLTRIADGWRKRIEPLGMLDFRERRIELADRQQELGLLIDRFRIAGRQRYGAAESLVGLRPPPLVLVHHALRDIRGGKIGIQ